MVGATAGGLGSALPIQLARNERSVSGWCGTAFWLTYNAPNGEVGVNSDQLDPGPILLLTQSSLCFVDLMPFLVSNEADASRLQ